jgi:hypothetical protein
MKIAPFDKTAFHQDHPKARCRSITCSWVASPSPWKMVNRMPRARFILLPISNITHGRYTFMQAPGFQLGVLGHTHLSTRTRMANSE